MDDEIEVSSSDKRKILTFIDSISDGIKLVPDDLVDDVFDELVRRHGPDYTIRLKLSMLRYEAFTVIEKILEDIRSIYKVQLAEIKKVIKEKVVKLAMYYSEATPILNGYLIMQISKACVVFQNIIDVAENRPGRHQDVSGRIREQL